MKENTGTFSHKHFSDPSKEVVYAGKFSDLICENCGKSFGMHIGNSCIPPEYTRSISPLNVSSKLKKGGVGMGTSTGTSTGIDKTLDERGSRYGEFTDHAYITQNLKRAMVDSKNWKELPLSMKESLEMIAHKLGRILNGDPYYKDSWVDIIGYAELINRELKDLTKD